VAAKNGTRYEASPLRKLKVGTWASSSWEQQTPDRAFDGAGDTVWNAGNYAPQWIETDLGGVTQLASLALLTTQMPDGPTTHEVWVSNEPIGADCTRAKLAHTFKGITHSGQRLAIDLPRDLRARHVQIRTTRSPSWVAWAEIELRVQRPDGHYLCWSDRTAVKPQPAQPTGHRALPEPYPPGGVPVELCPPLRDYAYEPGRLTAFASTQKE
jgi:hypothetical protein